MIHVCDICGVETQDEEKHRQWHQDLNDQIARLSDKAGRYVPPPVYSDAALKENVVPVGWI